MGKQRFDMAVRGHDRQRRKWQARERAVLSDIYANTMIQRLGQVSEEVQRIYKRVSRPVV